MGKTVTKSKKSVDTKIEEGSILKAKVVQRFVNGMPTRTRANVPTNSLMYSLVNSEKIGDYIQSGQLYFRVEVDDLNIKSCKMKVVDCKEINLSGRNNVSLALKAVVEIPDHTGTQQFMCEGSVNLMLTSGNFTLTAVKKSA